MEKTCVILNPAAGSVTDVKSLVDLLAGLGHLHVEISGKRGAAEQLTRKALHRGYETIIAAGGDGTLNEVVNGIGEKADGIRVGLLPLGTGNDFARSLGLAPDLQSALNALRKGRTRAVDLIRVTSDRVRYFVNVSAGGFSGVVDERLTPEMKENWGPLAYVRGAAAALRDLRPYHTTVAVGNDECIAMDLYNVVVANGRYVAGGTPIAPNASIDDGMLDVILLTATSASQLAMLMPQIVLGSHLSSSAVVFRRASKVTVNSRPKMWFNVDGELVGNEPSVFQVLPRALEFIVP